MYAKSELESGAPDGAYIYIYIQIELFFLLRAALWHNGMLLLKVFLFTMPGGVGNGMITMITSPGGASNFSASSNSLGILQATTTRCISMWKSTPPMEQSGKLSKSTSWRWMLFRHRNLCGNSCPSLGADWNLVVQINRTCQHVPEIYSTWHGYIM